MRIFLTMFFCLLFASCTKTESENNVDSSSKSSIAAATNDIKPESNAPHDIIVPQSKEESDYISNVFRCFDSDPQCYGFKKFRAYILSKYPDIAEVEIPLDGIDSDDEIANERRIEEFLVALYYAKQVEIADGLSMFDFLTTCGVYFSSSNMAQLTQDESKNRYMYVQFAVPLRKIQTREPYEEAFVFERKGDKFIVKTRWAMRFNDAMKFQGLECSK